MLALHRAVPRGIDFFLVQGKPANNDLQLPAWKRARQKLSVHTNRSLIFAVVHMYMRFVVLLRISKEHVDDDAGKTRQLWHGTSSASMTASYA